MKTIEIIGYKRANLGKAESKKIRDKGYVPCVLYGGREQVHFESPMILFRDLIYTPDAAFVHLNIEGDEYKAILQDIQFHPVSELILHADFLELNESKPIKMSIPVKFHGNSPGVQKGGRIQVKTGRVKVKALPGDMPESIDVDISKLDLGKSVRISDLSIGNFSILDNPRLTLASVNIPRGLKGAATEDATAGESAET